MPKVSIIVPMYNAARFIPKLVKSLSGQTYSNLEIILVDDKSTDNTVAICKKFQQKDSRIIIIEKPQNEGVDYARFTGIDHITGQFLMFIDADDWIERDTIFNFVNIALGNEVDIVIGITRRVYSRRLHIHRICPVSTDICNRKISGEEKRKLTISFMGQNIVPPAICGTLYNRTLFDNSIVKTGLKHGEDLAMALQLYYKASSIYITNYISYNYRWGG